MSAQLGCKVMHLLQHQLGDENARGCLSFGEDIVYNWGIIWICVAVGVDQTSISEPHRRKAS